MRIEAETGQRSSIFRSIMFIILEHPGANSNSEGRLRREALGAKVPLLPPMSNQHSAHGVDRRKTDPIWKGLTGMRLATPKPW